MHAHTPIITPVFVLIAWSLLMWVWMYATRIPAIRKANIKLDSHMVKGEQMSQLPASVRWKADNYTHLMEQPTIFYALVFALCLVDQGYGSNVWLAWAYVVLRIVHSLVQTLGNKIELRFMVFVVSTLCLFGLTINGLMAVLI